MILDGCWNKRTKIIDGFEVACGLRTRVIMVQNKKGEIVYVPVRRRHCDFEATRRPL